jgi:D-aminoacyl-tRNA deacylase
MRAVIQRVASASVCIAERDSVPVQVPGPPYTSIGRGLVALVGVERGDGPQDVDYIARKIRELRLFGDETTGAKAFERSVQDIGGEILVVSQFTVAADCRKGRRPSFDDAAPPEIAKPLYESVVAALRDAGQNVTTGVFQADMQVSLINDGPVTVLLDSRRRF